VTSSRGGKCLQLKDTNFALGEGFPAFPLIPAKLIPDAREPVGARSTMMSNNRIKGGGRHRAGS